MDYDVTKRVLAALEAHGVHYAIFGAVALNLHGLARFTEDIDLFLEPTADNVERLKTAQMKRNTVRLKDKADAHALKARFGLED